MWFQYRIHSVKFPHNFNVARSGAKTFVRSPVSRLQQSQTLQWNLNAIYLGWDSIINQERTCCSPNSLLSLKICKKECQSLTNIIIYSPRMSVKLMPKSVGPRFRATESDFWTGTGWPYWPKGIERPVDGRVCPQAEPVPAPRPQWELSCPASITRAGGQTGAFLPR